MKKNLLSGLVFLFLPLLLLGQQKNIVDSFRIYSDIKVTIDKPAGLSYKRKKIIVFYALPNGNTTAQTMGKKIQPGDDWHFDIQHIASQTKFIRGQLRKEDFIVVYLENDYKSWPAWKQKHPDYRIIIPKMVDSLSGLYGKKRTVYLNGHSGGGSFIFGFIAGTDVIPSYVKRISFLDSDYGYDSTYHSKLREWITKRSNFLNVFAYNDSVALYKGKPVVSATGGTWYRSRLMLSHLKPDFTFSKIQTDSLEIWKTNDGRAQFYFKYNLNRGIYHTQQVELNGFIHSVLCGTRLDSRGYSYYGIRAYSDYIE